MPRTKSFTQSAPKRALRRFLTSFEEFMESLEYTRPEFWKEIEASRRSGKVSAEEIEKRLGLWS
jgi:hypothetical protein